jgi:hypothetical protein
MHNYKDFCSECLCLLSCNPFFFGACSPPSASIYNNLKTSEGIFAIYLKKQNFIKKYLDCFNLHLDPTLSATSSHVGLCVIDAITDENPYRHSKLRSRKTHRSTKTQTSAFSRIGENKTISSTQFSAFYGIRVTERRYGMMADSLDVNFSHGTSSVKIAY